MDVINNYNSLDIITHKCKCGKVNEFIPDYARYFLEYQKTEPRKELVCPNCNAVIPVKRLYNKYLKK